MKTILAAVDGTAQRETVLERTARLAALFEAEVHVVSVMNPDTGWASALAGEYAATTQALEDQTRAVLAKACAELGGLGVACVTHAAVGPVAQEIARLAGDIKADLIVIGHRNLNWLNRLLEDSVGKSLLDATPCDVLVVAGAQ